MPLDAGRHSAAVETVEMPQGQNVPRHRPPFGRAERIAVALSLGVICWVISIGGGPLYAGVLLVLAIPAVLGLAILQGYGWLYAAIVTGIRRCYRSASERERSEKRSQSR